ncbi:MAG: Gldg family protein, partial [Gemmataceae bacterium]
NPRYFDYEEVSPTLNPGRISDLRKKFPLFTGDLGVIVSYGEKEDNYSFIPINELENSDLDPTGQSQSRSFNGEVRLLQELMYLAENKKQPVIYVLQGHGEPEEAGAGQAGMSSLRLKLMQTKYDVRTLKFPADLNPESAAVPADADVVLVVGPTRPLANAVPALRKYLSPAEPGKPKGKLVALIGPTPADPQNGNKMKETGLEALLREYNVDVTNEQILTLAIPQSEGFVLARSPQLVIVSPLPEAIDARQPLAQTFKNQPLNWFDCRKVQPSRNPSPPGGPTYSAQAIMGSYGVVWTEADMAADIGRQRQNLLQNAAAQRQKATEEAQPVMVAVTESAGGPHGSPGEQKPRLVVIGTSSVATNQFQSGQGGVITFDLIRGCIDWCRERTANIGVQPKTHSNYVLPRVSYARLFWVPSFAVLVGIFGFGMIIWNMRKR